MNRQTAIDSLIREKGLKPIPYQIDFLKKENFIKPFVLGAGTSSGKTFTSAMWLELFYSNPKNKGLKTLLIPASTIVLRDNMAESFEWFKPNFTYCVCKSKVELDAAMKGSCDVIIVLPQTAIRLVSSLKHFHNFVLDEAHQWYFKTTITSIIKKIKPKNQLLLTGTPSRFIANGDKFDFFFVPVMELYNLGLVSNVKIEVVSSIYNPSYSDYSSAYGSLKTSYNLKQKENEDSLRMVCEEMVKRLKNPSIIKDKHLMNRLLSNPLSVFGEIDKTIIFCHSQKQANQFHKTLSKIKELKDSVLISHSDIDKDSIMFNEFKTDNTKKILIAVDRGKLGFSMGELFNIVDFTLTQNLDMLLQMYGRLLRLSEKNPNKQKIYYKVATKNTSGYFVDLMTAMLCLTTEDYYSKYNGKNMGGIRIPKVLFNRTKSKKIINKTNKSKSVKPYVSMEQLGIPIDLNFFKNVSLYKQNDKFGTVAECTLDDVRRQAYDINYYDRVNPNFWNEKTIKEVTDKYSNYTDFRKNENAAFQAACKLGIVNIVTAHMEKRKLRTLKDFYSYIKQNNITKRYQLGTYRKLVTKFNLDLDKLFPKTKRDKWTEIDIRNVAKKYNDLTLFCKENKNAYFMAKKLGILDDISKNWSKPKRNTPYTNADIPHLLEIIKNCKGRNEVRNIVSARAYKLLDENGIIKKLFPNKIKANQYTK